MKQIIRRKLEGSRWYTKDIRSFALTLHFYSPKAYKYVRETWKNMLPGISTLRSWYQNIDGSPGFTQQALDAISRRTKGSKRVIVNLVLDEMAIREQRIYDRGGFKGGIDMGIGENYIENDCVPPANSALVLMAVSINDHWKVPIGYFLIRSLRAGERANLLTEALFALHKSGAYVFSITFDGAPTNLAMCTSLGANFTYGTNFNPTFINPATKDTVYIFFDLCHMIKLVRNCLGDKKILKTDDLKFIKWKFLVDLYNLQKREGLRTANKLTQKHIYYNTVLMNVKLAMQTLSESVCNSLLFLQNIIPDHEVNQQFEGSEGTAEFCRNFNNISDLLNCKNKFSKKEFGAPITEDTFFKLKSHAEEFEKYILSLRDVNDVPIIRTGRKTGFPGLLIDLRNMLGLYSKLRSFGQSYLLTYKLSQDFLETFFSAIRARGGFNNNPNTEQLKSSYKRLLVRHEIKEFQSGNCEFDHLKILSASSASKKENLRFENMVRDESIYIDTLWKLSAFVDDVVRYIAGFVAWKVHSKFACNICKDQLIGVNMPRLSALKNKGPFLIPSKDVIDICLKCEKIIRQNINKLSKTYKIR